MFASLKRNLGGARGSFAIGLPPQTILDPFCSLVCFGTWISEMSTGLKRNLGGARGSLVIGLPPDDLGSFWLLGVFRGLDFRNVDKFKA